MPFISRSAKVKMASPRSSDPMMPALDASSGLVTNVPVAPRIGGIGQA